MRAWAWAGSCLVAGLVAGAAAARAQGQSGQSQSGQGQSGQSPAGGRSPYTLQVQSRVVLTDVMVTDKQGHPVTGLRASDFRILDNGQAQALQSFEEHREQRARMEEASAERGSFSNDFLRHPPPQVNVLLFDTTTIGIVDQMYLFEQMRRLVRDMPGGEPVAVFTRSGDAAVQLCGFTDDRATVLAAIRRAIPRLRQPGAWMATDAATLQQMALYLSQVPGRKNLLWFTSGSNLYLRTDPMALGDELANAPGQRELYDLLEKERIALYPIDAMGLTVGFSMQMAAQQIQMREDAAATGGEAFVNTNGLAQATEHILATDGDYYTLAYAPNDLRGDDHWHRVAVKLDRPGYQLSYRHGYFDDGSNEAAPAGKTRVVLRADGSRVEVPNDRSEPIVFRVQVLPVSTIATTTAASPVKRGDLRYVVQYAVPARDVTAARVAGADAFYVVGTAVLAFDHDGELAARSLHKVTLRADAQKAESVPNATLEVNETVDLPPGHDYLYLAVWDTMTGRLGTVNAEVDVKKAGRGR